MRKIVLTALFALGITAVLVAMILLRPAKPHVQLTRSVTALRLEEINPVEKMKVTGIIEAWKEESLSFEVPGRINWVIDKGSEVVGSTNAYSLFNGGGALVAKLDTERYELRLKSAEANVKTAEAELDALRINVDTVITRQLESAKADVDNAERELKRVRGLFEKDAASQQEFDRVETSYKKSSARFNEIKAMIAVRKAEVMAAEARLEQLNQAVADAGMDLKRTELRVPYQGQIADVFADIGANVKAGQKVAQLIGMDPMVIKLNLSSELDSKFHYTDSVQVYPSDGREPILGMVNRKATVADPNTHTFGLELLVRNRVVNSAQNIPHEHQQLLQIQRTWPVANLTWKGEQKLAAITESIYSDDKGDFVWKIANRSGVAGAPVYQLKKAYVELFPGEHTLLGAYKFRVFKRSAGIEHMDFVAAGVPEEVVDNDRVVQIRKRRMFRPGDFVKVVLENRSADRGLYVPLKMVSSDSVKSWVFKVVRKPDGTATADKVFVSVKGRFNASVLVESPSLKEGDLLVNDGAHFIAPNEQINVKSIESVSL